MFSDCKTLAELNQARVQAASKYPIVEVNNAYNEQRKKILSARNNFIQLKFIEVPKFEPQMSAALIYKGSSTKPGVIEVRSDGIYV